MANSSSKTGVIIGIGAAVAAAIIGGIVVTNNIGKPTYEITEEEDGVSLTSEMIARFKRGDLPFSE